MATTLDSLTGYRPAAYTPASDATAPPDFAWHAYAAVAAASMIVIGLIWDISWHMSIGRDTFWTPAHVLIQAGGLIAGLGSGALALHITFRGTQQERASSVSFWGFRAPYGAWVCILGCGAMLTSAPFDDWWHDAYGLDVRIVSPPHILLGLGMLAIVFGAMVRTLALQNQEHSRRHSSLLFALSTGLHLSIVAVMLTQWSARSNMHFGSFYIALSTTVPIILIGSAVASRRRWAATTAAAVYMTVLAVTCWVLMLFPATPKLGPIYRDITHFVPLDFPLLLVVPAFAIDVAWQRVRTWPNMRASVALAATFLCTLLLTQWCFGIVLMEHGRNWVFHTDNFVYFQSVASEQYAFRFRQQPYGEFARDLLIALAIATLAAARGLGWGRWMSRIRR